MGWRGGGGGKKRKEKVLDAEQTESQFLHPRCAIPGTCYQNVEMNSQVSVRDKR